MRPRFCPRPSGRTAPTTARHGLLHSTRPQYHLQASPTAPAAPTRLDWSSVNKYSRFPLGYRARRHVQRFQKHRMLFGKWGFVGPLWLHRALPHREFGACQIQAFCRCSCGPYPRCGNLLVTIPVLMPARRSSPNKRWYSILGQRSSIV